MPLDPQVKSFLDQLAASPPAADIETLPVSESRKTYEISRVKNGPKEAVASIEERSIPAAGSHPMRIRIYRPHGKGPYPVMVYFHGGGWTFGSLETADETCRALTNAAGCLVISVDYRLAPEYKFPAAVEDAFAAVIWIAENATEIEGDPAKLVVAGDSAGANLAAVATHMAKEQGSPNILGQLLVCPATAFSFDTKSYQQYGIGYFLTKERMLWHTWKYLRNEEDQINPLAAPLLATHFEALPSAIMITAEYDPLRDDGLLYAQKLREAGVDVTSWCVEGMIHNFFTMPSRFEKGKEAISFVARELARWF